MFSLFFAAAYLIPQAPHIIHIVADDLGFNDIWTLQKDGSVRDNTATLTPSIMGAVQDGIALTSYHTYKVCSPSRAAIMTGRYPWGVGYYDMKGPSLSIPQDFKLVSDVLSEHGSYETHAIGKWNLGHHIKPLTPTRRGFKTFFGYYAACQTDYWTHGAPPNECGTKGENDAITDFSNSTLASIEPANKPGLRGVYNQVISISIEQYM